MIMLLINVALFLFSVLNFTFMVNSWRIRRKAIKVLDASRVIHDNTRSEYQKILHYSKMAEMDQAVRAEMALEFLHDTLNGYDEHYEKCNHLIRADWACNCGVDNWIASRDKFLKENECL